MPEIAEAPVCEHLSYSESDAAGVIADAKQKGRLSIVADTDMITVSTDSLSYAGKSSEFKEILEDESIGKCGYSLKRQMNILASQGIEMKGRLLDVELMRSACEAISRSGGVSCSGSGPGAVAIRPDGGKQLPPE